jgi:retinol-binding protein 3
MYEIQAAAALLLLGAAQPALAQPQALGPPDSAAAPVRRALEPAERHEIVGNAAVAAETRYADETAGRRLAARLRERLAAGAYEPHADPDELAAALTTDLRATVNDAHLRIIYEPNRQVAGEMRQFVGPNRGPQSYQRIDARSRAEIARTNYGFDRVERLPGNIGYLKLSRFVPLDYSAATAETAMAFLANADAVIIDVRGVPGGGPDLVQLLLSYFAGPQPRRFMTIYNRPMDEVVETWTLAEVQGARMTGRPLYILQDGDSASAAEMLSYGVQRLQLGTIVGETSAGAGNGGNMIALGSGMSLFLPQMRIVDGPGWEGTGVRPDLPTESEQALAIAHEAALQRLVSEAGDPALRRDRERTLQLLRATRTPADSASLVD